MQARRPPFETNHLGEDLRRRTILGARAMLYAQLVRTPLQLIALAALARLVPPEAFGLVAMATVAPMVLTPLTGEALGLAAIRSDSLNEDLASSLFWVNAALGLALTAGLVLAAPSLARVYGEPAVAPITVALSASLILHALSIQSFALLRRQMRFTATALVEVAALGLSIAAAIALAALHLDLWALIMLQVVPPGVRLILGTLLCGWRPSPPRATPGLRPLLVEGAHLTGAHLVGNVHDSLLPFALGRIGGPVPLGYHNRANALVSLPHSQILTVAQAVAQPVLARLAAEPDRLRRATGELMQRVMLVTAFLTLITASCTEPLIALFLGEDWGEAAPYVQWLALLLFVHPPVGVLAMAVLAAGSPRTLLVGKALDSLVTVAALAAAAPYGPLGLVAAYAVSGAVVRVAIFLWLAGRVVGIGWREFLAMTLPLAALSLAAAAAVLGLRSLLPPLPALPELILCTLAGLGVYLALGLAVPSVRANIRGSADLAGQLLRRSRTPSNA